jgi:AcrR family transcriptional regulator
LAHHPQNARETIIDAAEDVVIKVGARHLTLDAVATKAGVSKGGLLYHFSSKEELLHAMLDRRVERVTENRKQKLATLPKDPKSVISAHILALHEGDERTKRLSVALLAAIAHDPKLLKPYQQEFKRNLDEFCRGGLSFERAAVILLAVDGMKLLELFSLLPFTAKDRTRIIEEIMALTKEKKHAR